MSQLRGLVLSGGESRRMGRDKGLIPTTEGTWAQRAGTLLGTLGLSVAVVVREAQRAAYAEVLDPAFELLLDADLPLGGPLKGILSAHQKYPTHDWLVLPCDLPDMTAAVLRQLVLFYEQNPTATAWAYREPEGWQPLPGIYSARRLRYLTRVLGRGQLRRASLQQVLERGHSAALVLPSALKGTFRNYNYPGF
ncbi:hypothetical protein GCM10027275_07770 [Rhabdobacter roseus]|uniref:Molybdopterin-guanine dinucleotide biosynthesis protein A n=1 Tax=Rhabdobacter roseus TaxID=1655419 RepID=A0A840TEX8_9BACT|nr:molybdenum cofactor guanylyltransferase [Rhabdobacter roseus]MBB5282676.1 molybdopterin-guanine dinucleotide biosynthesis protein A [Rhabdobacter roseus]